MKFSIQDYDGSLEMRIYNEAYEKWSPFIKIGQILYLEGFNYQRQNGDYFFKPTDIRLLDSIGKDFFKFITLKVDVNDIDDKFIDQLVATLEAHPGNYPLNFKIVDEFDVHGLDLKSKKYSVDINFQLTNALEQQSISYKIN